MIVRNHSIVPDGLGAHVPVQGIRSVPAHARKDLHQILAMLLKLVAINRKLVPKLTGQARDIRAFQLPKLVQLHINLSQQIRQHTNLLVLLVPQLVQLIAPLARCVNLTQLRTEVCGCRRVAGCALRKVARGFHYATPRELTMRAAAYHSGTCAATAKRAMLSRRYICTASSNRAARFLPAPAHAPSASRNLLSVAIAPKV